MKTNAPGHPDIKDLAQRCVGPITQVWGQIANDLYEAAECCGESVTKDEAIDACLDANRLSFFYPEYKDLENEIYALNPEDSKKLERELRKIWNW